MRYLGGKYKLRKKIGSYLNSIRESGQFYWEPFVGAASVLSEMTGTRYASDFSAELIAMWQAVQDGWVPPESVTEEEYQRARNGEYPPHLTAFIAYGCSYSGKWFGGYARNYKPGITSRRELGTAKESSRSLVRIAPFIADVTFFHSDFLNSTATLRAPALIYCDPPYASTTGYGNVGEWSSSEFWDRARTLASYGHTVVVSEYTAPQDFGCVASWNVSTDLRGDDGRQPRIEKLFMLEY